MWTGAGERLWRPLNNPPRVMASAFGDDESRGLRPDAARPEFRPLSRRRLLRPPSEPLGRAEGRLGQGPIQLSNSRPTTRSTTISSPCGCRNCRRVAGAEFDFAYRLHWLADEPYPSELARCVATRLGNGGQPASRARRACASSWSSSWAARWETCPLASSRSRCCRPRAAASPMSITEAVPDSVPGHWRAQFDLTVDGNDPVEMRLFLRSATRSSRRTGLSVSSVLARPAPAKFPVGQRRPARPLRLSWAYRRADT